MAGPVRRSRATPATMMGPLISERQREKVDGYVQTAVAEGGKVVHRRPPARKPPERLLLRADVDRRRRARRDHRPGGGLRPGLAVLPFEDDDDAMPSPTTRSSGCPARSTAPTASGRRSVARRVRAGTISVNGGMWYGPDAPFGGYKQSGIGREMGVAGFEEYLETKTIAEPDRLNRAAQASWARIGGRSRVVRMPGSAAHTAATALTARLAV